ncbi:PHP domain-containing protein [Halostreptopolyspora alba]|uniref:PHP domain-containing protein n=1 Tax=Halostreptopolyspora alba TaxID=2487137 RepID=UPI00371471B1
MTRVDCHLHTVHSGDSVLSVDRLAVRVAQERLDVVCVTDHHTLAGAHEAIARDIGARVVVGEEIRTHDGEIIGLFLTDRVPYVLPLPEAVRRIRAQGGLVYVPHPLDRARRSVGRAGLTRLCAEGVVDVVETFNAKIGDQRLNTDAADIAAAHGVAGGVGSDAHDPPGVGAAYAEMPDFDGPRSFLAALREARVVGEYRDHAVDWEA